MKFRKRDSHGSDCDECPTYVCSWCRHSRPWCFGAGDDRPDWCDDCWWLFASLDDDAQPLSNAKESGT